MKKILFLILTIAVLAALVFAARAILSREPAPPYSSKQVVAPGIECYENDRYVVVVRPASEIGSDVVVKYKASEGERLSCDYEAREGDLEILNEDAEYMLALEGDLLFLDSGTGPGPRGVIVYDLRSRAKAFTDIYYHPFTIEEGKATYWTNPSAESIETGATASIDCPDEDLWESQGLLVADQSLVSLDIGTLEKIELGEFRCSPLQ